MKKTLIVILLILSIGLYSCKKDNSKKDVTPEIPLAATNFIKLVEQLDDVTLNSKDEINSAYYYYLGLNDSIKEYDAVKNAYATLQTKIASYNELYEAEMNEQNDKKLIIAFGTAVSELGNASDIVLEDEDKIKQVLKMYENLSNNAKAKVTSDYAKLQEIQNRYEYLKNLDSESYNKEIFVAKVNRLYEKISELTIDNKENIDSLKKQYSSFDQSVKNEENVMGAYNKLNELDNKMTLIIKDAETIEKFLDKVYALPTYDNLRYKDSAQAKQINECFDLYNSLSDDLKNKQSVIQAYQELTTIKNTFDNLIEPYDVNICGTLSFYNNETNQTTPIKKIMTRYNYDMETLKANMRVYLNFYIEGGAQAANPFYRLDITEKSTISAKEVREILTSLEGKEGYEKVTNGEHYCFSYRIESLNDTYGSSYYSDFFSRMVINW